MIYGALFLVTILMLPRGIVPSFQERWRAWTTARKTRLSSSARAMNQDQTAVLVERKGKG